MKPVDSSVQSRNLFPHAWFRSLLACMCAWVAFALVAHAVPTPFGYWSFDNASNRLATTSGTGTMSLVGSSASYVAGPNGTGDSAIQFNGTASPDSTYLRCYHNIPANGGGAQVNVYTMMWDVKYANSGKWKCLLQTSNPPVNDGDLFINTSGQVGSSANLGGYGSSTAAGTWYRIVLVVNTSSGTGGYDGKVFVNGVLAKQIYNLNVDSTLCLYASAVNGSFEIHCDDNSEDDTFALSSFAIWNTDLSNSDVAALGSPTTAFMKTDQTITFGSLPTHTFGDAPFTLSATASSNLPVSYSVVSGPATVSGSVVTLTGAGTVTIRASQAGNTSFNAAPNVDQSFTVLPGNSPPTASSVDLSTGTLLRNGKLRINIHASDPDAGDTITYACDFEGTGNLVTLSGPVADHVYANAGTFNLKIRVTDNHGLAGTDYTTSVQVDQAQSGSAGSFGTAWSSLVSSGGSFTGLSSYHAVSGLTAAVLAGTNNLPEQTVNMVWRDRASGENGLLASPVVRTAGFSDTGANPHVIRMTYDPSVVGSNPVCLGRYDGAAWTNAVDANTSGTANYLGANHPFNPASDFTLGNYGADASSHTAWAVVNQSCDFAVIQLVSSVKRTLVVQSAQGSPVPSVGSHTYASGTSVLCQVPTQTITNGTTQYVCSGWQMTGNVPNSGTGTSFTCTLTNDATLTWLWTTNYWLDLEVSGGGSLSKSSGWNAAGSNVVVDAQSSYTTGLFQSWSGDTAGCTISGTRITIPMDRARGSITALFKRSNAQLTVVSAHSSCVPAIGTYTNPQGTTMSLSATAVTSGTTQYVPIGWTMSGDSPHVGTGSSFSMTMTRDSVLTWNWATNYWLDTEVSGSGTVSVASSWQAAGSSVAVAATPGAGMRFSSWSGDTTGCVIGVDHIIIPMTGPRGPITANFVNDDDFTVVALPDTQNYSSSYPSIWTSMTSWIVNNKSALNIQFVTHEGDIVNTYNNSSEWANSVTGMNQLNGQVPYLMTLGNHDISGGQTDSNYLNNFGPNTSRWKTGGNYYPWFGGASPSGLSTYAKLTISGRPYIFLNLDIDCPTPELNWAQGVINANHNVLTFLTVHNWLAETGGSGSTGTGNGTRGRCHTTYTSVSQGNSPDAVWANFVKPNNEIFAIICGHNFAQYNIVENNNAGKPVQEIMADYQTLPNGGNGFIRLMKFRPSQSTIENTTYSPYLGRYMTQPTNSSDATGMLDLTDPNGGAFNLNIDFDHRFDGTLSVKYAGGPADGTTGATAYKPGTAVMSSAPDVQSGQTLYTCSGWTLSGSQSASGTSNSANIVMNGDATLTWNWATKYWLETSDTGMGQVSVYSGWQAANTPVTLSAVPNGTATFLRWSGDTQGCSINGSQITVPMNRPYSKITAEFSTPIPNYVLTVVSDQPSVSPSPGAYTYSPNDTAQCSAQNVATDTTQQFCLGWTTSAGSSGAGNTAAISMTSDTTLTWLWQTQYRFDAQSQGPGSLDVGNGWYAAGSNLTVHAVPNAHSHFVSWSGDLTGCSANNGTLQIPMNHAYQNITAVFATDQVKLTIVSDHGTPSPAVGVATYDYGSTVSLSVTNEANGTTRYVCTGWKLDGQEPATGTNSNVSFAITNDAVLTWQWQTQVYLTVTSDGHGVITPMNAAGWQPLGAVVNLHASPAAYYRFNKWSGDTADTATSGLAITMDGAKNIQAQFALATAAAGTPQWWLDHNHLVANGAYDAAEAADADHDGMSAANEFLAGSDPGTSSSAFKVSGILTQPSSEVQWASVSGWKYEVDLSTDLGTHYNTVANVDGNGGQATAGLASGVSGLIRIQTTPPVTAWDVPTNSNAVVRPMKLIPAGTFTMGENTSGADVEYPAHSITITSPYYMDTNDVTVADWTAVCTWAAAHGYDLNPTPLFNVPSNHPIQAVSWYDSVKWCNARSEMEGLVPCYYTDTQGQSVYRTGQVDLVNANVNWQGNGYRLPTEAQWERAARGGLAHAAFPWGDTANAANFNVWQYWVEVLNVQSPTFPWTTPVGYFNGTQNPPGPDMANGYGLYDMAGNVWQWSWDRFAAYSALPDFDPSGPSSGEQRVNRGGSWWNNVDDARCAKRYPYTPAGDNVYGSIGFRCIRNSSGIQTAPVQAPTVSIGILTGATAMTISKTGGDLSHDEISGLASLTFGGTLTVSEAGDPLAAGDSVKLFDAANYAGAFDTLQLPTLLPGLAWNASSLPVDGTIRVQQLNIGTYATATATDQSHTILAADLLNVCNSPDGHALSITGVGATSLKGGTILWNGSTIVYTPAKGTSGVDTLFYTVTDSTGAAAQGSITVNITGPAVHPAISGVTVDANTARLQILGLPNTTYQVQSSTDLVNWIDFGHVTSDDQGACELVDNERKLHPTRFYRIVLNP